jgi:hypothetical protein
VAEPAQGDAWKLRAGAVGALTLGGVSSIFPASAFPVSVALLATGLGLLCTLVLPRRSAVLTLTEWAILGFLLWMPVGFIKYEFGVDTSRDVPPGVLDWAATLMCLAFASHLAGLSVPWRLRGAGPLAKQPPGWFVLVGSSAVIASLSVFRVGANNWAGTLEPGGAGLAVGLAVGALPLLSAAAARQAATPGSVPMRLWCAVLTLAAIYVGLGDSSRRVFGAVAFGVLWAAAGRGRRFGVVRVGAVTAVMVLGVYYLLGTYMRAVSFGGGEPEGIQEDFVTAGRTARNLSTLDDYALCLEIYPKDVPHLLGESYLAAATTWLPRTIWKSKPVAFSKELAIRKALSTEEYVYSRDLERALAFQSYSGTLVGEAWANFGMAGVLAVPFLWGVLVATLGGLMERVDSGSWLGLLSGLIVFTALIENRGCSTTANGLLIAGVLLALAVGYAFGRRTAQGERALEGHGLRGGDRRVPSPGRIDRRH